MAMRASILIAVLWLAGCGHASAVQNPAPVMAASSTDATEQAILDALPRGGWSVEEVTPGRIVAFLSIRSHLLRCEISYDAQKVRVEYLDSDRLDAQRGKNGALYAHRNVNTWMTRLAQDIQAAVNQATSAEPLVPASGGEESVVEEPAAPAAP